MTATEHAPSCPDHGTMVPVDTTFGYVEGDLITATIEYHKDRPQDRPELEARVYALLPAGVPPDLPLPGQDRIGERIQELTGQGRLIRFAPIARQLRGLYRMDDDRPGRGVSIMALYSEPHWWEPPQLAPMAVYGHFGFGTPDDEQREGPFPDLSVLSQLLNEQLVPVIRSRADIGVPDDYAGPVPEWIRHGIRLWDLGSMLRTAA